MSNLNFSQSLISLKEELKEKYLDYFQKNREWLIFFADSNSFWQDLDEEKITENDREIIKLLTPEDEGYEVRRLHSLMMLGIVSGLEPSIDSLISMLCFTCPNANQIIYGLGLDFDPFIELKKRELKQNKQTISEPTSELDDIREQIKLQNGEIT